jgi:hypothetical protein
MTIPTHSPTRRLPYSLLLSAIAATDRIAGRSGHPLAAMLLGAIALAGLSAPAQAVSKFDVRIEAEKPGMQATSARFSVGGVETFDTLKKGWGQTLKTDFGTSGAITGVYSNLDILGADQYGGAGGKGNYAVTFSNSGFTLDLSTSIAGGVNYFGYWLSALDRGNLVSFYDQGKLLFTFDPASVLGGLERTGNAAQYYGNPNAPFAGHNRGEPYVFVNFFNQGGSFDRIHFQESPAWGGYESDNHSVGHFLSKGTSISVTGAVPEPTVWAMLIIGFTMVGAAARQRKSTAAA